MGRAISSSIPEAHGGQIWASNNPDGDATFSFNLPLAMTQEEARKVIHEATGAHMVRFTYIV
jgi:signal transduction histidine kinase